MLHFYFKKNTLFLFSSASSISLEYLAKPLQRAKRFRSILHRSFHFFAIFNFSFLKVISTPVPCAYVSKESTDYILFLLFYNLFYLIPTTFVILFPHDLFLCKYLCFYVGYEAIIYSCDILLHFLYIPVLCNHLEIHTLTFCFYLIMIDLKKLFIFHFSYCFFISKFFENYLFV